MNENRTSPDMEWQYLIEEILLLNAIWPIFRICILNEETLEERMLELDLAYCELEKLDLFFSVLSLAQICQVFTSVIIIILVFIGEQGRKFYIWWCNLYFLKAIFNSKFYYFCFFNFYFLATHCYDQGLTTDFTFRVHTWYDLGNYMGCWG